MVCTGGIPQKCSDFTTNGNAKKRKKFKCTEGRLLWALTVHITFPKIFAWGISCSEVLRIPNVLKEALGSSSEISHYPSRRRWAKETHWFWVFRKSLQSQNKKRMIFFPLFTLDPTKWLDRSTNLLRNWQLPITLANTLGCLLIRESEEQNCRDINNRQTCIWERNFTAYKVSAETKLGPT